MALENVFKNRGYHLKKSNFKVQDTTKVFYKENAEWYV